jgi:hypothetical protein
MLGVTQESLLSNNVIQQLLTLQSDIAINTNVQVLGG